MISLLLIIRVCLGFYGLVTVYGMEEEHMGIILNRATLWKLQIEHLLFPRIKRYPVGST